MAEMNSGGGPSETKENAPVYGYSDVQEFNYSDVDNGHTKTSVYDAAKSAGIFTDGCTVDGSNPWVVDQVEVYDGSSWTTVYSAGESVPVSVNWTAQTTEKIRVTTSWTGSLWSSTKVTVEAHYRGPVPHTHEL